MISLEPETKYYPDPREDELRKDITKEEIKKANKGEIGKRQLFKPLPAGEKQFLSPERRIEIVNNSEWDNSLNQLIFNKERADEILEKNKIPIQHFINDYKAGRITDETLEQFPEQKKALAHYKNAEAYISDTHQQLQSLFSKAYEFGDKNQRQILKILSKNFVKDLDRDPSTSGKSQAMQTLLQGLKQDGIAPEVNVPIEEFAIEQSAKTFGNTAFESYNKFKQNAPIISIENPPAGAAISTGEDLKKLVEKSREQFIERAKQEGVSESIAKKQAEKLLGVTWDVGHINMLRKQGATEKDILRETEQIKPLLKHVHLSDNFGFEHTELPMGMGNVPIKDIMQKLGKKGFEAKKIIEAASWWQHFSPAGGPQQSPFVPTLEAMGSPIYSMQMAPYWNQAQGFQQSYSSGMGMVLPDINFQTFGAGFSQLPAELGGQQQGAQGSRMSQTPME